MTVAKLNPNPARFRGWLASATRFVGMSGISFLTTFGTTVVASEWLAFSHQSAFGTALTVAFVQNYFMLRYFVYGGQSGSAVRQFVAYAVSAAVFRGIEYVSFDLLLTRLNLDYRYVTIITLVAFTVIKFVYYRLIFGGRKSSAAEAPAD